MAAIVKMMVLFFTFWDDGYCKTASLQLAIPVRVGLAYMVTVWEGDSHGRADIGNCNFRVYRYHCQNQMDRVFIYKLPSCLARAIDNGYKDAKGGEAGGERLLHHQHL
jgi:hypothetical protein